MSGCQPRASERKNPPSGGAFCRPNKKGPSPPVTAAYAVSQRTQEIGIRVAVGARPAQVLKQALLGGMALVCLALALQYLWIMDKGRHPKVVRTWMTGKIRTPPRIPKTTALVMHKPQAHNKT